VSLIAGAGLGATIVGAFFGTAAGSTSAQIALTVGPLVGTLLAIGLSAVLHRALRRVWFLRNRPERRVSVVARQPSDASDGEAERSAPPDSGVRPSTRAPAPALSHAFEEVALRRPVDSPAPEEALVPSPLIPILRHPPTIELSYGPQSSAPPSPLRRTEATLKLFPGDEPAANAPTVLDAAQPDLAEPTTPSREDAPRQTDPSPEVAATRSAPPASTPHIRPLVASSVDSGLGDNVRSLVPSEPPGSRATTPASATQEPAVYPAESIVKTTPHADEPWSRVLGATGTADGW
jgi:hypothetical protein